jgi:hypothetical protein
VSEATSLEALFDEFESLPARDAEDAKRDVVDRILAAVAARLADAGDDGRFRAVRDASARARMRSPGAAGFDDGVLALIDAAREAFEDGPLAEVVEVRSPRPGGAPADGDGVTEASEESFPASDPPGFVAGGDGSG